jgi:hypothetical protein
MFDGYFINDPARAGARMEDSPPRRGPATSGLISRPLGAEAGVFRPRDRA